MKGLGEKRASPELSGRLLMEKKAAQVLRLYQKKGVQWRKHELFFVLAEAEEGEVRGGGRNSRKVFLQVFKKCEKSLAISSISLLEA